MYLILTQCFPPAVGGIEQTLGSIAGALAARGRRVVVLADGGRSHFGRIDKTFEYRTVRFGGWKPIRRRLKARAAAGLIDSGQVETVICDTWKSLEHLPACTAPVVCLAHGAEYPPAGDSGRAMRVAKTLRKATLVAANSRFTAELVRPHLGPETVLRVVKTPIVVQEPPDPEALRRFMSAKGDNLLVVSIGRLEPRKGIDKVLESVAMLRSQGVKVTVMVGGSGSDRGRLEQMARDFGLAPGDIFLGYLSAAEKSALLSAADVFAMPARREGGSVEGYGLVYLEAGWFGAPSVAGREGGAEDAVSDGHTGLICDGSSTEDVFRTIKMILEQPELRRRLGELARVRAHEDTWESRIDDFLPPIKPPQDQPPRDGVQ